jgi:peptidoglycan/LPS O-acetylase OafA/YrhL
MMDIKKASNLVYRADIDGLRAIAVLAVIFYHAGIPGFSGGFVGVDIFFVISGFLITSIILKEVQTGKFSIARFYERRIRRIFPALYPVIFACFIGAFFLFRVVPYKQFAESVATTVAFCSNLFFLFKSGDYFGGEAAKIPLLHTWSLAVEEQFYIVFPLFLVLINKFLKKKYFPWIFAMAIISFACSVYVVNINKSAAFYLAPTRAWELLVGSIISLNAIPLIRAKWMRGCMALLGILCIGYSIWFYTEATLFPGLSALLPVLGAGLVILSSQGGSSFVYKALSFSPLVFTGLISYSLYLWHWPLLVFLKYYLMRDLIPLETFGVIVFTFIVSIFSWKFIEQPFRAKSPIFTRYHIFALSGVVMLVAFVAGGIVFLKNGEPNRFADNAMMYSIENDPLWTTKMCTRGDFIAKNITAVRMGEEKKLPSFLLWGDSHAQALYPGLAAVAKRHGSAGFIITKGGFPPILLIGTKRKSYSEQEFNNIIRFISGHKEIKTVILAASWSGYTEKRDAYELSLQQTVSKLLSMDRDVVLVADVPIMKFNIPLAMIIAYRTNRTLQDILPSPLYDLLPTRSNYLADNKGILTVFNKLAVNPRVTIIYPDSMLLDNDKYRISTDTQLFYMDSGHLSSAGSHFVSPVFDPIFTKTIPFNLQSNKVFVSSF